MRGTSGARGGSEEGQGDEWEVIGQWRGLFGGSFLAIYDRVVQRTHGSQGHGKREKPGKR